jgi:outer membrane lipoprotein-sorting protein
MTAADPHRLRIEVISPFGPVVSIVAIEGTYMTALSPMTGQYVRGDLGQGSQRFPVPIPIALTDLPPILRGVVPLEEGRTREVEGVTLEVLDAENAVIQTVRFDAEGGWPVEVAWADGTVIRFSEYGAVDSVSLPHRLEVDDDRGGTAEVRLSGIELNPSLEDSLFTIEPPAGAKIREF